MTLHVTIKFEGDRGSGKSTLSRYISTHLTNAFSALGLKVTNVEDPRSSDDTIIVSMEKLDIDKIHLITKLLNMD